MQLPLPYSEASIVNSIPMEKDADGLSSRSVAMLLQDADSPIPHLDFSVELPPETSSSSPHPLIVPCTPLGIIELIRAHNIPTFGKHVVIVGRSNIVGKPLMSLFLRRLFGSTVTIVHSNTLNPCRITKTADILISATGEAHLITPEWVSEGTVVIDVGISQIPDASTRSGFKIVGDVSPEASRMASHYTPVPGGVGPMTVAMLLYNTFQLTKYQLLGK